VTRPAACLLDVYETVLTCDFSRHTEELPKLAGVPQEAWYGAFLRIARSLTCGELTAADGFAWMLREAGGSPNPPLVRALLDLDRRLLIESTRVYDDVAPFLERLRAEGIATALVSNCSENTRPLLAHFGLLDLVDEVVLSCEVQSAKPSPDIYMAAVQALGIGPPSAIFVDDQVGYCAGAADVGLRPVRIARGGSSEEGVISGFAELQPMFGLGAT
jgi:putative hydrolase of the HAD superfamily